MGRNARIGYANDDGRERHQTPQAASYAQKGRAGRLLRSTARQRGVTLGDVLSDGRYRLTSLLGFSPISSVWLAKDKGAAGARRSVALKVVPLSSPSHAAVAANEHAALTSLRDHLSAEAPPPSTAAPAAAAAAAPAGGAHLAAAGPPAPDGRGGGDAGGGRDGPDRRSGGGSREGGASSSGRGGSGRGSGGCCCCARPADHFAPLLDHFEHVGSGGRRLLVMSMPCLGRSLAQLLRTPPGPLPPSGITSRPQRQEQHPAAAHTLGLPLPAVRTLARHLLHALDTLHTGLSLAHCDVKPGNVLVRGWVAGAGWAGAQAGGGGVGRGGGGRRSGDDGQREGSGGSADLSRATWCLVDFGMCRPLVRGEEATAAPGAAQQRHQHQHHYQHQHQHQHQHQQLATQHPAQQQLPPYRTLAYVSPEALLDCAPGRKGGADGAYGAPGDVWAAACVAYEAAAGQKLFDVVAEAARARNRAGIGGGGGLLSVVPHSSSSDGDGDEDDERALMRLMVHALGPPPPSLLGRAQDRGLADFAAALSQQANKHTHDRDHTQPNAWLPGWLGDALERNAARSKRERVTQLLSDRLSSCPSASPNGLRDCRGAARELAEFLTPLLEWEPGARPSAAAAARHAFLRGGSGSDGRVGGS
ncbi:hypothetical protein FOA52_010735 [Chlamydomonas sp. UWO 241]|nr:hypothetical protein FOA52_010735 [Chlamydomonas sp. UWO 241]